jgi:hypothetical protein
LTRSITPNENLPLLIFRIKRQLKYTGEDDYKIAIVQI